MRSDLRVERARFLLKEARRQLKDLEDQLKDAPLRIRRQGLPLALATWSHEGHDPLVQLVAKWLFEGWGVLEGRGAPQGTKPILDALIKLDAEAPALRSAAEREAELFLQAAKVLSSAVSEGSRD
jgi:hypothetical protein